MKTYTEIVGHKLFNWFEALNKKNINWNDLEERASSWITCACGNQCDIIPRYVSGEPKDKKLSDLGVEFYDHIREYNKSKALETLAQIEKRSAKLIKQIQNENKPNATQAP